MMGQMAKFIANDPHNFSIVNGGIELLEIEDIVGDRLGIALFLLFCWLRPLIKQAQHAISHKPLSFITDCCPCYFRFTASIGNRL